MDLLDMDRRPHPLSGLSAPSFAGLSPWQGYGVAVASTTATLLARMAIDDVLGGQPTLIAFAIPIMLSAYLGGLRAGLLSTLLAFLAAPDQQDDSADRGRWLTL